ncbi:homeobox protein NANOG [Esox lucius]|uniref:Homeobox domain-containing protein n=1 Tax=Esox lucius TaxID=8010 RepID=A0A3P8YYG1_ESOLU|nr:homeobox protein NANOG [Esox lucius]
MADWKLPVSYNYSPSYHAFAYGLMYQAGTEQNHPNFSGWTEYNPPGVGGGYYSQAQQQPQHQSPPRSPEHNIGANNGPYPGSSVLYLSDPHNHTQSGRLLIAHNMATYGQRTKETEPPSSDTPSDSESQVLTSPDSWSSGSSKEGYVPQTNPAIWVKKELNEEVDSGSPNGSEHVSSSYPEEEPTNPQVPGSEECTPQLLPPSPQERNVKITPKQKARTAFSAGQMDALTNRFNIQKYLTPAEMKTLAGLTGLSYKQVKTWFQNRRMKLKRHQKDNSWVSAGYPNHGYPSMPPRPQGEPQVQIPEQPANAQQFREAGFQKSPPLNTPYYAGGYQLPPHPAQPPPRTPGRWPLPPAVTHYEYPNGYSAVRGYGTGSVNPNASINSDGDTNSPMSMAMVPSASQ